jgi:hypothetical protein
VEVLKQALDEAWACIAFTIAPHLAENTRLSLAHAIVAHAGLGDNDRETLKAVEDNARREDTSAGASFYSGCVRNQSFSAFLGTLGQKPVAL